MSKNSSGGLEDKFKKMIGHLKVWEKIILLVSKVRVVTEASQDTSCHSSQGGAPREELPEKLKNS